MTTPDTIRQLRAAAELAQREQRPFTAHPTLWISILDAYAAALSERDAALRERDAAQAREAGTRDMAAIGQAAVTAAYALIAEHAERAEREIFATWGQLPKEEL